ncbi:DinB family protein [Meiothermus ruber]|jgi:uncharacterized damage-inducible protein DinB|uniref:DinB family protein n=1 Tax=Meiothermus ruber (strain ATCC 35948 / DSM 1279 / VKM B-1258 / 21) TaxID=504728 RepID=D3PPH4_MEIRD|nr:DinB family protein [Meiothermus ruber]GIW30111.1 MAG: hypothetical protein KatS3mg071_0285 [Meiothermus sp.]ADD29588.1 DinB family protein [Meiothermus ruber DSM 1279]AGK04959.1 DinB family protein [Meiothermus ruber DSM 1279]MCL6530362.1 DinB family protein [Meiothermus ruber]GAO76505.1 DinB family protein [Meiothermus ruber H328]
MRNSVSEALLDSFQRNNTILLNLLRALPEGGLEARAMEGSPSVGEQFAHIQNTRLFWLQQVAPEFAEGLLPLFYQDPDDRSAEGIEPAFEESARAICKAVKHRLEAGQPMEGAHARYDHPVLFLQHMLWHEGYHVGQIKLALKRTGYVMPEVLEEQAIWSLWRTEVW